jgi:UDP-2-acetamido-2,6-beta-L-arabino-hexul-4-ose reductase
MKDMVIYEYDLDSPPDVLHRALSESEIVFHLAGVNRPDNPEDFHTGNTGSLEDICRRLSATGRNPKMVLSSSIQALLDNPYGVSKRAAEDVLRVYSEQSGAPGVVYRFKNLFGKWCRPNYNSVTATFCHNIANNLPIQISNDAYEIDLTYVDDVVNALIGEIHEPGKGFRFADELTSTRISLGDLARLITSFSNIRTRLFLPDFSNPFVRALYATYLSYLPQSGFSHGLDIKTDERGSLAEFIKAPGFGQIFISHTKPGVTRGHHFHHTKTEKFMVVYGEGMIRFRQIDGTDVIEYPVKGEEYRVLDIPPGYTHSIENTGNCTMVTLFWASEVFDPERPDTYFEKVDNE